MARQIDFKAKATAEQVLQTVLHRRNFSVDLRDALADRLEQIVLQAFQDEGITAVNKSDR